MTAGSTGKILVRLDDELKRELMSSTLSNSVVEVAGREYSLESVAGSGFKGVVWKAIDKWGVPFALKFTIAEDYAGRSYLQEVTLAKKLLGYQRFAQCVDAKVVELTLSTGPNKFVCFVEEWIDGLTLEQFIENGHCSSTFLLEFIKMMSEALSNLKYWKLCHDDLRASNIKIAPPKPGSLEPNETQVKIIDTGSLKHVPSVKPMDDHRWFVQHIIDIRNAIYRKKHLSRAEKRFVSLIVPLIDKMLEEDCSVALTNPSKIVQQFDDAWKECCSSTEDREQKLDDPFYYISAETISSDKLLVDLFAESCPWTNDVLSPDPIVLTGPRGCGKSTIFRRMSLKGMLYKGTEELLKSGIAGFYISCTIDLRNHVNWIKSENLIRRFRGELMHYFNLVITKEIVSAFSVISNRNDKVTLFGFSQSEEKSLFDFIVTRLMITETDRLYLQGINPMRHALELIESEMGRCHEAMMGRLSMSNCTSGSYISELATYITENIPYFRSRKIVFFIDDLSTRQIPKEVQSVFNDVILQRAMNHTFKISSDKYGWTGLDSLAAIGEKTREFKEVDCGKYFLVDADEKTKEKFTTELLAKRLLLSGFKGTPEEIIGHSIYTEGSLGKAIRQRTQNKVNLNEVYFGLETITSLSCGDISVLLEIYRRIFKTGKVTAESHGVVSRYLQQKAIKSVSRELYNHIKSYRPYGDEMFAIVTHFGIMSRCILREAALIKQKDTYVVPETTRIEIDEDPSQPQIAYTSLQKETMLELIKRAIFIELDPGSARRSSAPSLRLQLRPVLCPTFMTSPFKSFPLKWTPEDFRYFLSAPEDKCKFEFEKMKKSKKESVGLTLTEFNQK